MKNLDDFELSNSIQSESISELYQKYTAFKATLKDIPLKTLQENGWLQDFDDTQALSQIFTNTLSTENPLFRKHTSAKQQLTALWLAKVTASAKQKECTHSYHPNGIDKSYLKKIAQLSQRVEVLPQLPSILAEQGIILIYEKSLPSLKMDGAVFLLPSGVPVIALSLRYNRLDSFWFTLLHELAHIVLHYETLQTPIIDDLEGSEQDTSEIELEANRLAKDSFVTRSQWRSCPAKYKQNVEEVVKFSADIGIHPAIVAGLLRKEHHKYNFYTSLIHTIDTRELVFNHD